jgi:hypothetical protein
MAEISDALNLVIRQRGGGKRVSIGVYLRHTLANFLLWQSHSFYGGLKRTTI